MAIEIDQTTSKSRLYFRGDTFAVKEDIKDLGGHWDADERAWWVGRSKLVEAQALASSPTAAQPKVDEVTDSTVIKGRATYKDKKGYLILWQGTTSKGRAVKLATRDGKRIFWAEDSAILVEKMYPDREWRGRTEPGMTFGRLNRLAADYKQAKKDGIEPCGKCGGLHGKDEQVCYMCSCTKCDGAHGGLCEDD